MTINGLSGYGGFQNYKVTDIPKVDIETVKRQDALKAENDASVLAPEIDKDSAPIQKVEDKRSKSADLDNISLTFNAGDDYSYIGSDFEIGNLDIEQAISDMQKDKVLQDYQYFVGNSNNLNDLSNADGKVIIKF